MQGVWRVTIKYVNIRIIYILNKVVNSIYDTFIWAIILRNFTRILNYYTRIYIIYNIY